MMSATGGKSRILQRKEKGGADPLCWGDNIPDVWRSVYEATSQIPKGKVSTYGDIANALGDPVSARAVGEVLSHNPTPIVVPCHRIVYSTGEVGWYGGSGKGSDTKIELLRKEGVDVIDGKVKDLDAVRFRDFHIEPVLKELRERQDSVRDRIVPEDEFGTLKKVAGLDVSYDGDFAYAALVVQDAESGEVVEERTVRSKVLFPYIPTYLSFREIPAICSLVHEKENIVYLIDGQGVLHPRGAGIASHIGVLLDIPTVGAAKSLLVGSPEDGGLERAPISLNGKIKGYLIKGKGGKANYISVGHRVSLSTAVDICSRFMTATVPEPLRRAHVLANKARLEEKRSP